jgi:DHA2 family multidrug resistance protein
MMMWGYFYMAHFTLEVGWWHILPGMLLTGSGMALTFSIMSATCMRTIPPALLSAATGLYTLSRRIGGNLGYAFAASQIPYRTTVHRGHLVEHLTPYDGGMLQALDGLTWRLASSGLPPGVAEQSALKLLDSTVHRQATMMAYNDVFWIMGMLFIFGLPLLLLLGTRPRRPASAPSNTSSQHA